MTPTDDWNDLTRAWTGAPQEPIRPDATLIRALRRRDTLARLNFIGEVAGAGGVLAIVVWAMVARDLPWSAGFAAVAFAAFGMVMTVWARQGAAKLLVEIPEAVLRHAIEQARLGRRWAWAGLANSVAGLVFVGALAALAPSGQARNIVPLVIGPILLLGCLGFYARHARRCSLRMRAHQAALRALTDP